MTLTKADSAIQQCIEEGRSFVLDAGAGSGKTSSLVGALQYMIGGVIGQNLNLNGQRIACITYTKVAKGEIFRRINESHLVQVSTIHEFLWSCIKDFQEPLKAALMAHNDELGGRVSSELLSESLAKISVQYSDVGPHYLEGKVFHDDVLKLSLRMFRQYGFLGKLVASRYPYIFVDEYQDTSVNVIELLMDYLFGQAVKRGLVGFFGDKMQRIYSSGVGELPEKYLLRLERIEKQENYRCSHAVIRVLNKIRDDITQYGAGDNHTGDAVYINAASVADLDVLTVVRDHLIVHRGWHLDIGETKELFLTHKLIARKGGYGELLAVFDRAGSVTLERALSGENCVVQFVMTRVWPVIESWRDGKSGVTLSLMREGGFSARHGQSKSEVRAALAALSDLAESQTIGDVLGLLKSRDIMTVPNSVWSTVFGVGEAEGDQAHIEGLSDVSFAQLLALCRFIQKSTPFSTKHGVKGAEFEHVIVVLDDKGANWSNYSFERYLSGDTKQPIKQYTMTRNLFYVSCSRAMRNLVVVDLMPLKSDAKRLRIADIFGGDNVVVL